ncbi:alpha/beta hydrolase [Amycolatopsis sp. NPDC048633]|uniref:alpha/beta hydrolase n=1 Tax=Amycolatopsis sp. NPDC048633 TaxID=3157095 RepID=UPI0033D295EA
MTVYREVLGFRPLELDLHLPSSSGPFPAIVYLHGGGWRRGSRQTTIPASLCSTLASRGFAVAAVDYRLSGEAQFPAQLDDVRAAVDWLQSEVDCARTFLWGESAGAHLALLAALDGGSVDGVVAWYPPTDLLGLDGDVSRETQLLGVSPRDNPALARQASPLSFVREDAPPILLMHGDADDMVPPDQSVRLASALRAVGAPVELDLVPGARHMWADAQDLGAIVDRSVQFLRGLA